MLSDQGAWSGLAAAGSSPAGGGRGCQRHTGLFTVKWTFPSFISCGLYLGYLKTAGTFKYK